MGSLNPKGRYARGGNTENKGQKLGWWERRLFNKDPDTDIFYTVTARTAKRPDLIAYDIYGDPSLMWIILQYAAIVDIEEEIIIDAVLQLPSPETVTFNILNG